MGVSESLGAVAKAFPQARLVAFADLSSRMILSSAGSLATTQEHLDRLCDQARASFDDPLFALSVEAFGEPQGADDEYLTDNSIRFHEHMGFRRIGVFTRSGYKFGRWYNMSWAEKLLMEHPEHPEPVIPFPQLDKALVADILRRAAE